MLDYDAQNLHLAGLPSPDSLVTGISHVGNNQYNEFRVLVTFNSPTLGTYVYNILRGARILDPGEYDVHGFAYGPGLPRHPETSFDVLFLGTLVTVTEIPEPSTVIMTAIGISLLFLPLPLRRRYFIP
jgi:hypothetical protein